MERFTIAFARPCRLRFEQDEATVGPEEEWIRTVLIWNEGVVTWTMLPDGSRSSDEAWSAARFGQLFTPVGLLLQEADGLDPLPSPESASILGVDELDGRDCVVIQGTLKEWDEPHTFWIGLQDRLVHRKCFTTVYDERVRQKQLLRMQEEWKRGSPAERDALQEFLELFSRPMEPYRSETTITFHPVLDPEVPPETFAMPR